jgi:hypothetical protein
VKFISLQHVLYANEFHKFEIDEQKRTGLYPYMYALGTRGCTYIPTKSICRLFFRTTHVKGRRSYYGLGNIVWLDRLAKLPDCKYARYSAQSCVRLRPPFGLCVMQSFANDVKKH